MIAWKRAYVNTYRMYKKGATVLGFNSDYAPEQDAIQVDNVDDFQDIVNVSNAITLFNWDNTLNVTTTITEIVPIDNDEFAIIVNDLGMNSLPLSAIVNPNPNSIEQFFQGIKLTDNVEYLDVSLYDYLERPYGDNPAGDAEEPIPGYVSEGSGAFIEIKDLSNGTHVLVPKMKRLTAGIYTIPLFLSAWREKSATQTRNNIDVLIAHYFLPDWALGKAYDISNTLGIFETKARDVHPFLFDRYIKDAICHEIGHCLGLDEGDNSHIDNNLDVGCHNCTNVYDRCLMAYGRSGIDGVVEFDHTTSASQDGCINLLRSAVEPL